jgi:large conductance mechanosensitive channel
MLKEFRTFIMRGNVIDLAVGVIIGAAFGKIVSSLVDDILMPPIGMAMSGLDFKTLAAQLKPAVVDATGKVVEPAVEIRYGLFLNALIQFLIVAFCVFLLVKAVNKVMPKKEEEPAGPSETDLLTEIRDLLKESS